MTNRGEKGSIPATGSDTQRAGTKRRRTTVQVLAFLVIMMAVAVISQQALVLMRSLDSQATLMQAMTSESKHFADLEGQSAKRSHGPEPLAAGKGGAGNIAGISHSSRVAPGTKFHGAGVGAEETKGNGVELLDFVRPKGATANPRAPVRLISAQSSPGQEAERGRGELSVGARVEGDCGGGGRVEWPLYNVTEYEDWIAKTKGKSYAIPGSTGRVYGGYARLSKDYDWGRRGQGLNDLGFQNFRFYIYADGSFDMSSTFDCLARKYNCDLPSKNPDKWFESIDEHMSIVNREYFPEISLIHALLRHPQRTLDPEEASMFFIGFSPAAVEHAHPCDEDMYSPAFNGSGWGYRERWFDTIAENITNSKYFIRNGGKDHLHIYTWYYLQANSKLRSVLDTGPMILTVERYLGMLTGLFPKTYENDRVVILPYVSSTATDAADPPVPRDVSRHSPENWWLFRGNMARRGTTGLARQQLPALGKELGRGVDFADVKVNMKNRKYPKAVLLRQTAATMRGAAVCLCPAGDSPTSLRLFEALAIGCLPVIMADKMHMLHDLPFPNLIDWGSIALFTEDLHTISKCPEGLHILASVLNKTVGINVEGAVRDAMNEMRKRGQRVFQQYMSYFRNPGGVATGVLYETYALMKSQGTLFDKS